MNKKWYAVEYLYMAWLAFSRGKKRKRDVIAFYADLENQLWQLYADVATGEYTPGPYHRFVIHDPKKRVIHKATVRDRVLHRAIYEEILPVFHRRWLDCSFSCRPGFGQHRAVTAVQRAILAATRNYTREAWILKCDVRKFFDSVDHQVLFGLLQKKITGEKMLEMIWKIITSFHSGRPGVGLPIGNLVSQVFANVYLHELDWFVKQRLHIRTYYRYADDFIFLLEERRGADSMVNEVSTFLRTQLHLDLHPKKIIIRKAAWGIDWLGVVICPGAMLLRKSTERRMMRMVAAMMESGADEEIAMSVLGSYHRLLQSVARRRIDECLCQTVAFYR